MGEYYLLYYDSMELFQEKGCFRPSPARLRMHWARIWGTIITECLCSLLLNAYK
jgi:hypothetical protein